MQITVTTQDGVVHPLDVSDELPLGDLKAVLEFEVGIPAKEMLVIHNMTQLRNDEKMLKDFGVKKGDVLLTMKMSVQQRQQNFPPSSSQPLRPHSHTSPYSRTSPHPHASPQTHTSEQLPFIDWSSVQIPG